VDGGGDSIKNNRTRTNSDNNEQDENKPPVGDFHRKN